VANWRFYSNTAVPDTLVVTGGGNLSTSATSIQAGSGAPAGYPASFPFTLRLEPNTSNEELVSVSSGLGTAASPWVITRAYDGTTAKTHNAGTALAHGSSAGDFTTAASHYALGSGSGVHGLPASAWSTPIMAKIQDTTLSNSTTSVVTFSGIPNTYSHLLLFAQGRLTETTVQSDDVSLQFNGDSSSVYSYVTQYATNPSGTMTSGIGNGSSGTGVPVFRFTASQAGANVNPGGGFIVIPNYTSTAFNKAIYGLSGGGNGTSTFVDIRTRLGIYNPATQAAVSSLSLSAPSSSDFLTGSRFTLYGIS
jgi:hypothetical protein